LGVCCGFRSGVGQFVVSPCGVWIPGLVCGVVLSCSAHVALMWCRWE
jgi:hypothetical protein